MDLYCALCLSRGARMLAVTVVRGWALCERHSAFDAALHQPGLEDAAFRQLLARAAVEVDC